MFGNALSNLNKLIFYCEIIGCKRIILDNKIYWFIKRKIIINKKITISVANRFKFMKFNSKILYFNSSRIYNYFFKIRPEIRINYLKFEIIKNLPIDFLMTLYLYILEVVIFLIKNIIDGILNLLYVFIKRY